MDLTNLNRHVKRPFHPLASPKDEVASVSSRARYFSVVDAVHSYWQIPLEEGSQHLTTFVTPWGRYKFLRATMGLVSSGDEYCRRTDEALNGLDRLIKVVDDMCQHSDDLTTHVHGVWNLLTVCRENNITLSPDKRQLIVEQANFAG